jgi:hypothetical protein
MIMRIGWVTGSAYEWTQHAGGDDRGDPPDVLAVRDWRNSDRLTAATGVLAATDESLAGKSISTPPGPRWRRTSPMETGQFIIAMGNWLMF